MLRALGTLIAGVFAFLFLGPLEVEARPDANRPTGRIAYSDGDVCLVDADGSGRRCRTRHLGIDYAPIVWSFDGKLLAFQREHGSPDPGDRSEVVITGPAGRNVVRLTPPETDDYTPAWSPVAPRIAFSRLDRSGGTTNLDGLYTASGDGKGGRRIVSGYTAGPSWSPDGRKIAFFRSGTGIYLVNRDGSGMRRVSRRSPRDLVEWSPNGRRFVFSYALTPTSSEHVFLMNADGSGFRRLTSRCRSDFDPTWSPDGRKIAFTCLRKNQDTFSANADGSELRQLTTNGASDNFAAWSPDGQWIAYVAYLGNTNGVWVMRSDGRDRQRLTPSTYDSPPTWDPSRK